VAGVSGQQPLLCTANRACDLDWRRQPLTPGFPGEGHFPCPSASRPGHGHHTGQPQTSQPESLKSWRQR
jgi:hypothetical protein